METFPSIWLQSARNNSAVCSKTYCNMLGLDHFHFGEWSVDWCSCLWQCIQTCQHSHFPRFLLYFPLLSLSLSCCAPVLFVSFPANFYNLRGPSKFIMNNYHTQQSISCFFKCLSDVIQFARSSMKHNLHTRHTISTHLSPLLHSKGVCTAALCAGSLSSCPLSSSLWCWRESLPTGSTIRLEGLTLPHLTF